MKYTLKKKFFVLLGKEFSITNEEGLLVGYAKQKAFKLREELTIFADQQMTTPFVSIKARNIIDFNAIYDVFDATSGESLGAIRRMGFRSMLRDEWHIYSPGDNELAVVQEESGVLALVRRLLTNLVPQRFDLRVGDQDAGGFQQQFNPFKYVMDIEVNEALIDKRVAFACAVLLAAVEGRQE